MSGIDRPTFARKPARAWSAAGRTAPTERRLAAEVPVALVFDGTSVAVMMATPTDLEAFAVGFAVSEGFVSSLSQIERMECVDQQQGIEVRLWLGEAASKALAERRRSMLGPVGCGLCGLESLEQAARPLPRVAAPTLSLAMGEISAAASALRARQPLHDETQAVHGAGFLVPGQGFADVMEDVGRHNALDKLIGARLQAGLGFSDGAVVMTSRLSLDLVQKVAVAGCPVLIGVSAPTTAAVDAAHQAGITLIALARGDGFQVFAGEEALLLR